MTTEERRHFSPEQKMAALRRHRLAHVPVSDLCDEYEVQPADACSVRYEQCLRRMASRT